MAALIAVDSVKAAQSAFLAALEQKHNKTVEELQTGDKPTDQLKKSIVEVAHQVAKQYKEKAKK